MDFLSFIPDQLSSALALLPALFGLGVMIFGSALATVIVGVVFYLFYKDTDKQLKPALVATAHVVLPYMVLGFVLKTLDAVFMRPYIQTPFWCFVGLLAALWAFIPHYFLWRYVPAAPRRNKIKASLCFLNTLFRSIVALPFTLSCWIVVPIALLFTKKDATSLPGVLDAFYGHTQGLSKDKQSSYTERLLWLLRHRCNKLKKLLGIEVSNEDYYVYYYHGTNTPLNDRTTQGFSLTVYESYVELTGVMYLGKLMGKYPICLRCHYGFKLSRVTGPFVPRDQYIADRKVPVATTVLSLVSFKGQVA